MDLFSSLIDEKANLLPGDGVVSYFGIILPKPQADCEYTYTYSNTTRRALVWTEELLSSKNYVKLQF